MAVRSRAVTVTTTATRLDEAPDDGAGLQGMSLYNNGAVDVWIGDADVSPSTGTPIAPGVHYPIEIDRVEQLYGRVVSGTADVRVLEVG